MIKGEKVNLRPVEMKDLDMFVVWRNDPASRRNFFTPLLINPGGQKNWYETLLTNQNKIIFAVDDLEGNLVGLIGMDNIDWRNQVFEGGPILFSPEERSKGYAEESIRLMINYAFMELNLRRMYVSCFPFNPIVELMMWYGFQEEGVLRLAVYSQGKFYDKIILAILRDEWMELWHEE